MVFHWSLSDSKSPQVSRTLLSILAVLNNAVVWMVSTRPPTSKSSSPISNPLVTVLNAPITIGIIVTCMFHSFFSSLARSRYLSFFYYYYYFYYYFSPSEFSPAAGDLSFKSDWLQVSSGFQDASEFSCQSQQCCLLLFVCLPPWAYSLFTNFTHSIFKPWETNQNLCTEHIPTQCNFYIKLSNLILPVILKNSLLNHFSDHYSWNHLTILTIILETIQLNLNFFYSIAMGFPNIYYIISKKI